MHCTAGKDRTGVGSALLLTALGVPRATVIADYALTAHYLRSPGARAHLARKAPSLSRVSPAALRVLLAADPTWIEASFASIDEHYGDFAAYRRRALRVSDAALARLRAQLLV